MKKSTRRLRICGETLRVLAALDLARVAAGGPDIQLMDTGGPNNTCVQAARVDSGGPNRTCVA